MEPIAHSQKKYSLRIVNQQGYRNAISAKLNFASASLYAGTQFVENNILDMYIEGRLNSRPTQAGNVEKIIVEGIFCAVAFVIVSFQDETTLEDVYFLLAVGNNGEISIAPGSQGITAQDARFNSDKIDIKDFFDK